MKVQQQGWLVRADTLLGKSASRLVSSGAGRCGHSHLVPRFRACRAGTSTPNRNSRSAWNEVTEISRMQQGALIKIKSRSQRGFRVDLEGDNVEVATNHREPLALPLKLHSRFGFAFRHSGANFRVLSISSEGVLIEVLATAGWGRKNQTILLPWSAPVPN